MNTKWYTPPDEVEYSWRNGGSTTDPNGRVVIGLEQQRLRVDGKEPPRRVWKLKTGPEGYVECYDDPPQLDDSKEEVVSHVLRGHVEYSYAK